jgi:hypothetical protein
LSRLTDSQSAYASITRKWTPSPNAGGALNLQTSEA